MKNLAPRPFVVSLLAMAAAALGSCAGTPEPNVLSTPLLEYEVLHFAGTLLTGPSPAAVDATALTAESAFDVSCEVTFVDRMPRDTLEALGARAIMVFDSRDADPLRVFSPLASGSRVGSGEAAERAIEAATDPRSVRAVELAHLNGVSAGGVTAAFIVGSEATIEDPVEGPTRRSVTILVSRDDADPETPAQVALLLQRRQGTVGTGDGQDEQLVARQIILLQDRPSLDGKPLALFVPSPFPDYPETGFIAVVRITPPSDHPAHVDRVQRVAAQLAETTAEAKRRTTEFTEQPSGQRALVQGLAALAFAHDQRPALIFLAATADGILSLDLALSGDDALLAEWIDDLQTQLAATDGDQARASGGELGWRFEQSAWRTALRSEIASRLSPAVRGLLLRRAGEAARYPDLLLPAVNAARNRDDLSDRLVDMNLEALSDNDVAARARAHDWLRSQGLAVPDYDPFASRAERRAALDRAAEAQATQSGGSGT